MIVVCRSLESLHRKELDNNRLLRQQLSSVQATVRQLNDVQQEAAVLKRKVIELQNVQSVINGEELPCFRYKIFLVSVLGIFTKVSLVHGWFGSQGLKSATKDRHIRTCEKLQKAYWHTEVGCTEIYLIFMQKITYSLSILQFQGALLAELTGSMVPRPCYKLVLPSLL